MSLVVGLSIQNFKCYRKSQSFDLTQANFFIGANNAGKSAILKALHCFFSDDEYSSEFINKTELKSKGSNYNKSIVGITFDLRVIKTKTLSKSLKTKFGDTLVLFKNFTYRESTNTVLIDYTLKGKTYTKDELPIEVLTLLGKISLSYIHPQESKQLLEKAQEKLKSRLLANWGRSATLKDTLSELQVQWDDLRQKANVYLSSGLTQSLQGIWPGCATGVDLPENVDQIIAVSEIVFRGSSDLPDVSLTYQGTGAQSTILYQTHFLLDSDKTLHRGIYYPIWLIEEPESFLHADIIFKLGNMLCSDNWLDNIQMFITTHSPLLLATSKQNGERISWFSLEDHGLVDGKKVREWTDEDIREFGVLMGDPNFDIYFKTSDSSTIILIEDTKEITERKFIEAGIQVTQRLNGVSELRRYFDVLRAIDNSTITRNVYLLIDNDDGLGEFQNVLKTGNKLTTTKSGFTKYEFKNNVYLIVFPEKYAVEELFDEHDSVLESCANKIFDDVYKKATTEKSIPPSLTRAHASIRNKVVTGLADAKKMIRNQQDVKDTFWKEVDQRKYKINTALAKEIISLMV